MPSDAELGAPSLQGTLLVFQDGDALVVGDAFPAQGIELVVQGELLGGKGLVEGPEFAQQPGDGSEFLPRWGGLLAGAVGLELELRCFAGEGIPAS